MKTLEKAREQIIETIYELPEETLPELTNFISYLQFKTAGVASAAGTAEKDRRHGGRSFLLAIADLGVAEEDLAEHAEEILAREWEHFSR